MAQITDELRHEYLLGFTPGFPYLGGLPERIAAPRLETPRKLVAAGSVGIAGSQTGIFLLCVALSMLSLVSLRGFGRSVNASLLRDARGLHAADVILHAHRDFSPALAAAVDALSRTGAVEATRTWEFTSMVTLVGLSGSLRQGSFNSSLLRSAVELLPEGAELRIASIRGIPLYDGDVEASEGIPAAVAALKEAIASAAGLLLATPEYNNSIPGVAKNAIDWLSRPPSDIRRVFGGKPVALVGASPGGFGTILSQNAWLPVFRTLGAQLWADGRLLVSRAQGVFAEDGTLTDPKVRDALRKFLEGYVKFIESTRQGRS
jgi:NAD(P)H-dependent FMN reductase